MTAVASLSTSITAVEANEININLVADDIVSVVAVGQNIADILAVEANEANIDTVAGISANVTTVAGIAPAVSNVSSISSAVSAVNSNSSNINAVAGNATNINAVVANATNINAVAGNATNINAVNTNSSNINTVAGISANVTTVATNNANVTTVATNIANVNTNATNIASINTNASNIVAIQNASANATAAAASATAAAASFDSFDDRYLGAKSSAPTLDNDGNTLLTGALYFNTVDSAMKVWNGTIWVDAYASLSGALLANNNLSDVTNAATARDNLGVEIGVDVQAYDADTTKNDVSNTFTQSQVFPAGTVSAPAITTTGDTNTGIFFPAADTIAFTEGGVEVMRINSAGNVGIGTSSPLGRLDVNGTSTVAFVRTTDTTSPTLALFVNGGSNGVGTISVDNGGIMTFDTGSTGAGQAERMRIDSSGNVGIGTSSPSLKLDVAQGVKTTTASAITTGGFRTTDADSLGLFFRQKTDATAANRFTGIQSFDNNVGPANLILQDLGGNVGIGTSSPSARLHARASTVSADILYATNSNNRGLNVNTNASDNLQISHTNSNFNIDYWVSGTGVHTFSTSGSERMRIASNGYVYIGRTSDTDVAGITLGNDGFIRANRDDTTVMVINRNISDGDLVSFRQAGTTEGTISVSGTTVSYNGGHLSRWSQLLNSSKDNSILKGTVMSNLDEMCVWEKDGVVTENEQLNKMKVSDVEGDTNVAGVFVNWTMDEAYGVDDMNVAMTGDMIIRIADGVVVQKGDLLMSAGDGTAMPQGDDIVRSKTIAKVTSNNVTCTYADGSYCVPCVLMAC